LAAVFVCAHAARAGEPLGVDQEQFATAGRLLRDGLLPYRDLADTRPPLQLYTWLLAWAGGSVRGAWAFEAVWLGATMLVAFGAARRWQGNWAGFAAAACVFVGLWAPRLGGHASRLQPEELLALPVLAAAWLAVIAVWRPRAALGCGALTGIAALYKVAAIAIAIAWLVLWWTSLDRRAAVARAAWFVAGIAAPWLVMIVWFAAHGALGPFLDTVFGSGRSLDAPWGDVLAQFFSTAALAFAPLWIAAGAGVALAWKRDRARGMCLAAWIASAILAIALQRQLAGYPFLLLVPPLAVASGIGIVELLALRRARYGLVLVAILAALTARDWIGTYGSHGARAHAPVSILPGSATHGRSWSALTMLGLRPCSHSGTYASQVATKEFQWRV
jgi:hypothetical protein